MSNGLSDVYYLQGIQALLGMLVTLICIAVVWHLLQEVRWEKLLRQPAHPRARFLQLVAAIVIGYGVARFLLDYWAWTGAIRWLFRAG
jgi:uncharacterized integral membrane protein (TIGR02327 family)